MNRLKDLQEKRGAKLKEAAALVQKATTEKRELTADENTKIVGLHDEAENFATGILNETRQLALEGQRQPALSEGEKRDVGSFDFQRLLQHMHANARGANVGVLDGVEAEMIQEGAREARDAGVRAGGVVLPRILVRRNPMGNVERRDLTATGTTSVAGDQGGMTIATQKAGLLDDFYNASVIRAAGATVLEGLVGNLDLPRLTAGTAPAKKAENANADETSPLTAMLSLSPKRLPAYVDISERLLAQSSSAIEAVLRRNLTAQMSAIQEAAFFHGGGTDEANGIAGTANIGSVAGGAAGAAPTWTHLVNLEREVDTQNALLGNLRYISNGQIRAKLKTTPKVAIVQA
jgi:HK97 family phage major capsid protein